MSEPTRLQRAPDGRLLLLRDEASVPVRPRRCFPWASPNEWISLRDDDGHEQALIHLPETLEPASRDLLLQELRDSAHTFRITRILECRKEIELRCWRVETEQGPRTFQTELDEWPQRLPRGGILIRDLAGDLYTVADPDKLDPDSRAKLWVLLN
jgi:hypothetical protein